MKDLGDTRAWKLLHAIPRMILYPIDPEAQKKGATRMSSRL